MDNRHSATFRSKSSRTSPPQTALLFHWLMAMPKPNAERLIANFRFCASIAFICCNAFMWKCSKSASGPGSTPAIMMFPSSSFHWISKLSKWPAAGNSQSQTYSNTRRKQNRSINLEDRKLRLQDSVQSCWWVHLKENGTRRRTCSCLRQSLRITYSLEGSYNCLALPFLLGPKSPSTPRHQQHHHHQRQHQHL